MKSILVTYPDFQSLPKGVKRMLVASESLFFGEAHGPAVQTRAIRPAAVITPNAGLNRFEARSAQILPTLWGN